MPTSLSNAKKLKSSLQFELDDAADAAAGHVCARIKTLYLITVVVASSHNFSQLYLVALEDADCRFIQGCQHKNLFQPYAIDP